MPRKFAITGHIACGKSTVAEMLESLGWEIIDADQVVRELYEPSQEGHKRVLDTFGACVLKSDQTIDRAALAQIVFSDPSKLELLNSLIHPLVRQSIESRLAASLKTNPNKRIVCVIPLFFETHDHYAFDAIVCVGASASVQKERLLAQGLSPNDIEKRLMAQWPMEKKIEKSNHLIWNNGSLEHLKAQVMHLHRLWI